MVAHFAIYSYDCEKLNMSISEITPWNSALDILDDCPKDKIIADNLIIAYSKINSPIYGKIACGISGGSDSDVVMDIVSRCDKDNKVTYMYFDTGLEYQATKDHIKELEEKYGKKILVLKPKVAIPKSCKVYGQPFMSKLVSEFMYRLQKHNFQWEDEPYEVLIKKYPKCQSALEWWCDTKGNGSSFNIRRNKWLKEFIIEFHPWFNISNKCCKYAKKDLLHDAMNEGNYDLNIYGVRKAEGGARAHAYKNCYSCNENKYDEYRPIFWYKDENKTAYEEYYGIQHSDCYSVYGLLRTGCCGCPYSRNLQQELEIIQKFEPKLYKAVTNVFKDSYEYTKLYYKFCDEMDAIHGSYASYLRGNNE